MKTRRGKQYNFRASLGFPVLSTARLKLAVINAIGTGGAALPSCSKDFLYLSFAIPYIRDVTKKTKNKKKNKKKTKKLKIKNNI
jgi:hypothetical protein